MGKPPDTHDKNRELHELLGLCWHEYPGPTEWLGCNCLKCGRLYRGEHDDNPDYTTDPRLVLREMMKREDWRGLKGFATYLTTELGGRRFLDIPLTLILDTTGKLRDMAMDKLKEENDAKDKV